MNSILRTKEIILEKKERKKISNQTLKTVISLPELKKLSQSKILVKKRKNYHYINIFKIKTIFRRKSKPINNVLNIRYTEMK